ncbi:invasion associated locus B family protein [Bradyrhizobium sp. HKCCYLR1023]|uniref:invasion associated locus B family protein n=1 Tax=Bradyrhizobium TaxID=374 RepID=UPI003EBF44D5
MIAEKVIAMLRPKTLCTVSLVGVALALCARTAAADELETQASFKIWSVICSTPPAKSACAVVAAVRSNEEAGVWARAGLSVSDITGDLEMVIAVPRLTFFKTGLSLSFDGKQYGRAFIDQCNSSSCESTVKIEPELRHLLVTQEKMTVGYPVTENDGELVTFNLDGILQALSYLADKKGNEAQTVASAHSFSRTSADSSSVIINVELRSPSAKSQISTPTRDSDAMMKSCATAPPVKEIYLSNDLKILNPADLSQWINSAKNCRDSRVVWIVPNGSSKDASNSSSKGGRQPALTRDTLGVYAVFDSVKDQMQTAKDQKPQVLMLIDGKARAPVGEAAPQPGIVPASFKPSSPRGR